MKSGVVRVQREEGRGKEDEEEEGRERKLIPFGQ
jgi:hypothetical protein